LGVPDPRILIVGCGGSGNNTLNRITHLGVEGAVTVAINTDKQHLDHTRALAETSRRTPHHPWTWVQAAIRPLDAVVQKPVVR
jgi:UDP-N-acetylmuramoylalanine-D-glutamate ligase